MEKSKKEQKEMIKLTDFLKEILSTDPILDKVRANKAKVNKDRLDKKIAMSKRVYGKKRQDLEYDLEDFEDRLIGLKQDRRSIMRDMEAEAGQDDWSDEKANEYGSRLEELDLEIESIENKIEKIEDILSY